ncbi:16262_t:CDS:10 [Rhizophagus irregularis]|nr:16262_t:CDS:10 [Rhizophagus irregularis]
MAKKHRFLFLNSQIINKSITHLKYKKSDTLPPPQPLDTQTPVFTYDQIPFQNTPVEPTSEVNPAPDFDIPGDLKPFIPADGQLYLKKSRKKRILLEPDKKRKAALLGTSVKRSDLRAAMAPHYRCKGSTSEEAKELEKRPRKRNVDKSTNLDSHKIVHPDKKARPSTEFFTGSQLEMLSIGNPRFVPGTKNVLLKNARILDGIGGDFIGDLILKDGIILSLKEIKRRINVRAKDAINPSDPGKQLVEITTSSMLKFNGGESGYVIKMRPVTTLSVEDMGINYGINPEEEKEWRCLIALFRCYNCYEHHALDAYRIPDVIKRASSQITTATFSDLWGYKKEAFQASTRSPKILADAGIPVAHQFIVVWDSHLLDLRATPLEVYIDGIPQFDTTPVSNIEKVFIDVDTIIESNSSLNGKNINISIILKMVWNDSSWYLVEIDQKAITSDGFAPIIVNLDSKHRVIKL